MGSRSFLRFNRMSKSFSYLCLIISNPVTGDRSLIQSLVEAIPKNWPIFQKKRREKSSKNANKNTFTISLWTLKEKEPWMKHWFTFLDLKLWMIKYSAKNLSRKHRSLKDHSSSTFQRFWYSHSKGSNSTFKIWSETN